MPPEQMSCPFCHKPVTVGATRCGSCWETLPPGLVTGEGGVVTIDASALPAEVRIENGGAYLANLIAAVVTGLLLAAVVTGVAWMWIGAWSTLLGTGLAFAIVISVCKKTFVSISVDREIHIKYLIGKIDVPCAELKEVRAQRQVFELHGVPGVPVHARTVVTFELRDGRQVNATTTPADALQFLMRARS